MLADFDISTVQKPIHNVVFGSLFPIHSHFNDKTDGRKEKHSQTKTLTMKM